MAEVPIPVESTVSQTRNSWLRDQTKGLTQGIAGAIHERFPRVSPNHLTAAGALIFSAGTHLLEWENRRGSERRPLVVATGASMMLIGAGLDGVDGPLSRLKEAENPGKHNQDIGQLGDYVADRVEEVDAAFTRAETARGKGDRLGQVLALANGSTATIPGVFRAQAEVLDRTVPEQGTTIFEAAGTRPGRVALALAAGLLPKYQRHLDAFGTGANINASIQRWKIVSQKGEPAGLTDRVRSQARLRRNTLAPVAIAVAGIALGRARK